MSVIIVIITNGIVSKSEYEMPIWSLPLFFVVSINLFHMPFSSICHLVAYVQRFFGLESDFAASALRETPFFQACSKCFNEPICYCIDARILSKPGTFLSWLWWECG